MPLQQNLMIFKVVHKKEVHVFIQDKPHIEDLIAQLRNTYTRLPECFSILYVDEQGDKMTINGQADLEALFYVVNQTNTLLLQIEDLTEDIFKMNLEEPELISEAHIPSDIELEKAEVIGEEQAVHPGVECNQCGANPILGIRYKCTQCNDYDCCQQCESFIEHPHDFIKIKHPGEGPHTLSSQVGGGNQGLEINGVQISKDQYNHLMGYSAPPSTSLTGKSSEEVLLESATYLEQLFDIPFDRALSFVQQNPTPNRQELVQLYITKPNK